MLCNKSTTNPQQINRTIEWEF